MRLFGFGAQQQAEGDAPDTAPAFAAAHASRAPGHEARRDLLERNNEFLLGNALEVSPRNLPIAHAAFSGSILGLARKITAAQAAGLITQDWLDEAVADDPDLAEGKGSIEAMLTTMDRTLHAFGESARKAHTTTGEYGAALTKHANHFPGAAPGPVDTAQLAEMTRAMIEHTRQVEEDMRRTEKEAKGLRASLARAQRDAEIDHLTGLPNRRAFEAFGSRHLVNRQTDEPIGFVTFSGGIANVFGYDNPRAALHAADEALYRAKQGGRNQILVA